MIGIRSRVVLAAASAVFGIVAVGCQNDGGGEVISRTQDQDVRPDGTAVQTRTQVRETDTGARVRETQTQKREVIEPADSGAADPTQRDATR